MHLILCMHLSYTIKPQFDHGPVVVIGSLSSAFNYTCDFLSYELSGAVVLSAFAAYATESTLTVAC